MNIYVGNLSWSMTDDDLSNLFSQYGTVTSAKILKEKNTGRSKGFGVGHVPVMPQQTATIRRIQWGGLETCGRLSNRPARSTIARRISSRPTPSPIQMLSRHHTSCRLGLCSPNPPRWRRWARASIPVWVRRYRARCRTNRSGHPRVAAPAAAAGFPRESRTGWASPDNRPA